MNLSALSSIQDMVKAPTTLDKIPEDVQLAIIKFIQSWKKSEGTEQEREKGKRARDSALRAMALSCRKLLSIYRPGLLSNVTLNNRSLLRFYLSLVENPDSGKLVNSITFTHQDVDQLTSEQKAEVQKVFPDIIEALRAQEIKFEQEITVNHIVEGVYRFLPNIQELVILQPEFNVPLQSRLTSGNSSLLPFLTHSLKKLFTPFWRNTENIFNARNVVWILVFCTGLRSACLGFIFDQKDWKYLSEFSDTFSGLSKVSKLSLGVNFTFDDSTRRYWDRGVGKQWIGGNKKTQAVFYLLKVTKNLQCLELSNFPSIAGEKSCVKSGCFSALKSSFKSLENLRLFGIDPHHDGPEGYKANLLLFVKVTVLSIDAMMVLSLPKSLDWKLPPGVKILCIPYYYPQTAFREDLELARSFKVRTYPSLESVVVPSRPISKTGVVTGSEVFKSNWLEGRRELEKAGVFTGRRELEKAGVFTSGKVELRVFEPGESIGDSSRTAFMSTLIWLSPP